MIDFQKVPLPQLPEENEDSNSKNGSSQYLITSKGYPILIFAIIFFVTIGVSLDSQNSVKDSDLLRSSIRINLPILSNEQNSTSRVMAAEEYAADEASSAKYVQEKFKRIKDEHLDTGEATLPHIATNKYAYPNVIYGHVHMAKTGGTTLNGILANRFERVCGNKGNSLNAYIVNNKLGHKAKKGERISSRDIEYNPWVNGFEDCDLISLETSSKFWEQENNFHGIPRELHVPCRDPVDHLLSQCNHRNIDFKCEASSDEEFYASIEDCFVVLNERFDATLVDKFDVRCFDFKNSFTTYIEYMSDRLQQRRLISSPFIHRSSNKPRHKSEECIWKNADLMEKAKKYLVENIPYYRFCSECIGTEKEIGRV